MLALPAQLLNMHTVIILLFFITKVQSYRSLKNIFKFMRSRKNISTSGDLRF